MSHTVIVFLLFVFDLDSLLTSNNEHSRSTVWTRGLDADKHPYCQLTSLLCQPRGGGRALADNNDGRLTVYFKPLRL